VAPKGAVFVAAFSSLHGSVEIVLCKLDLEFLHWARSCFAALLIEEGGRLAENQLQADRGVDAATTTGYCQTLSQRGTKTCSDQLLFTGEVWSPTEV